MKIPSAKDKFGQRAKFGNLVTKFMGGDEYGHLGIEVKVNDNAGLTTTFDAIDWLLDRNYVDNVDWNVNMHAATLGYSSFYFKDPELATEFTLVFR